MIPWQREDGIAYRMVSRFHATSSFLKVYSQGEWTWHENRLHTIFSVSCGREGGKMTLFFTETVQQAHFIFDTSSFRTKNDLSSTQTMCTIRYIEIVIYFDMCVCCSFPFNLWGDQRCQRSLGWSEVRIPVYLIIWLSLSSTEPSSTMYLHLPRDSPKVILNPGNNWIVWFHLFGDLL